MIALDQSLRLPAGCSGRLGRGGRAVTCEPTAAEGEVAFWRCANERAQAQSVAADIERLIVGEGVPPGQIAVLVPSISREGQAVGGGARGAGGRPPRGRRDRVLPARRDPGRARVAAAAGRSDRRGRGRARAGAAAGRVALGRHRALYPDRAPAQARHGRCARGRDGVAAGAAGGARADPRVPRGSTGRRCRRSTAPGRTCMCTA